MQIDYSKSFEDIRAEEKARADNEEGLYNLQVEESRRLLDCESRKSCVLCNKGLVGERFMHREVGFVICGTCGHIQTAAVPPSNYPRAGFERIYPKLSAEAYEDRKKRVYKPKLDWIVKCFMDLGLSLEEIRGLAWTEIGAGGGYFISCLADFGARRIVGFDADKNLVDRANSYGGIDRVRFYEGDLSEALELFSADVYVAYFVLEHIESIYRFLLRLRELPGGTKFVFSVPVFGFSCVLENIFKRNYARNLDCVYHTQLFTDASIAYAMKMAGFEIVAQWIFGQDVSDLMRFISNSISKADTAGIAARIMDGCVSVQDGWQQSLDRLHLSDQRHIVGIKR